MTNYAALSGVQEPGEEIIVDLEAMLHVGACISTSHTRSLKFDEIIEGFREVPQGEQNASLALNILPGRCFRRSIRGGLPTGDICHWEYAREILTFVFAFLLPTF